MANHPLTGAYLPTQSADPPAGGTQISQAVSQLSPFTVPRFTSTALREQAYSSWVAQGGAMTDGMLCAVGGTLYMRRSGAWKALVIDDSDTGWIDFNLAGGWNESFARYRVRNGFYSFTLAATRSSWSENTTLFTIASAAHRPSFQHSFTGMWGGVAKEVKVQTSGTVVMAGTNGSTGVAVAGSWPI